MNLYGQIITRESDRLSYGELMDKLWPQGEYCDGAAIAWAGLEDSSKLRKLIDRTAVLTEDDYYFCVIDQLQEFKFVTPLLRAIQRKRSENVFLLLNQEANPDGVPYEHQLAHARRYRRFCFVESATLTDMAIDVEKEDIGTASSQMDPPFLTDGELQERRAKLAQFWTHPSRPLVDHSKDTAQWHSVAKAGAATPQILDQLLNAGAYMTAWCGSTSPSLPEDEEELQPSQLCITTPVHVAITSENHQMPQKLFDSGISPDSQALITGNQALTPIQYAIMLGDLEAYTILINNGADASITTPVFEVHALHFAAARLRVDLLRKIGFGSRDAPVTNMGHTLLHVACLPFNRDQIQSRAPKVAQSIHDLRVLIPRFRWRSGRTITYDEGGEEYSKNV